MTDLVEMLEATLDLVDAGVAILDDQANVVFWNKAAATITGYAAQDVISLPCPPHLYSVDEDRHGHIDSADLMSRQSERSRGDIKNHEPSLDFSPKDSSPNPVSLIHRQGHLVPGMLRQVFLHNSRGEPSGKALLFYSVEEVNALPHGELGEGADIERSQAEMEDRLDAAHHQWKTARIPYGLLWITIDQAQELRKTHGRDACDAMLRTVEQTLQRQMKPAEMMGRWGSNEFLVLAHERTSDLLAEHARRLAGLARTADFRWWGDRVGLTVSIGASHATEGETLQALLSRARQAMHASAYAGGNHVTEARKA
jgi:diguanylate cyclase (GGDEF)-like protein